MSAVIAAIITLVGTLLLGVLGYIQWRRTQSTSERKEYRAKRVETLARVWETLTEIEQEQRTEMMADQRSTKPLAQDSLRRVNLLLMRSAPFLLDDEREWAVLIIQYILEIDTALRILTEQGKPGVDWWINSRVQPESANVTARAASQLRDASTALAYRYAAVMRGEHD